MASRPSIALCTGSDCRKRSEHGVLDRALRGIAEVVPVRCLGLCHSPVAAVLDAAGRHVIFERLRSPKVRRDLVALVARGAQPSKRLADRRVTGTAHRKALIRLTRRLPR